MLGVFVAMFVDDVFGNIEGPFDDEELASCFALGFEAVDYYTGKSLRAFVMSRDEVSMRQSMPREECERAINAALEEEARRARRSEQ